MATNLQSLRPLLSGMRTCLSHSATESLRKTVLSPRIVHAISSSTTVYPHSLCVAKHFQEKKATPLFHGIQTTPRESDLHLYLRELKIEEKLRPSSVVQKTAQATNPLLEKTLQNAATGFTAATVETGYKATHTEAFQKEAADKGFDVAIEKAALKIPEDLMDFTDMSSCLPCSFALRAALDTVVDLWRAKSLQEAAISSGKRFGEAGTRYGSYLTAASTVASALPEVITAGTTPLAVATTAIATGALAFGVNKAAMVLGRHFYTSFTSDQKDGKTDPFEEDTRSHDIEHFE